MTIIVHHLENSRSQRVLWLLEELGLPYEVKRYERNKATMLAPPELRRVHPLGKSPVVEYGGHSLIETGAIIDYLVTLAARSARRSRGGTALHALPPLCRGIADAAAAAQAGPRPHPPLR